MSGVPEAPRGRTGSSASDGAPPSAGLHFFPTATHLRTWYEENHDRFDELWVGYYKKGTGLPTVSIAESIDQALCFGWIDGLKRSVDDKSYKVRFTPRRRRSRWSERNLKRMELLIEAGQVAEAGLAAYPGPEALKEVAGRPPRPRACRLGG